jgi:hypothetical protein
VPIFRFADHRGFDRKPSDSSLDTDMSVILASLYRLSNNPGCGERQAVHASMHVS